MKYYCAVTNEGSEFVVVHAKNKFMVRVILNYDCESIEQLTADKAKKLIAKGIRLIK